MNQKAQVSVVVVNWNSGEHLVACLQSVLEQTHAPGEILVIDNASTDGSPVRGKHALESHPRGPEIRWVMNEANLGFSRAANQGIAATSGEWFLLLNPDVILTRTYLEEACSALHTRPTCGALAGKLLRFDRQTIDTTGQFLRSSRRVYERGYGEKDQGAYDDAGEVFSVCGAVAFYRRTMLNDVAIDGEWFDEDFFAFYEDADLGWRAQRKGWRCWYQPTAVAYHARGGTNEPRGASMWKKWQLPHRPLQIQFHILINRYLMLIKNESFGDMILHLPMLAWAELLDWAYIFFVQPRLLGLVSQASRLLKRAFAKRSLVLG